MKRLLLLPLIAAAYVASQASTTVTLGGREFNVDTVFHAKVGPGTTQTSLSLSGPLSLKVFYLTVDRNTPGVSIRALSGRDMLAGTGYTSTMAQTHSTETTHYFAGSNGDFYFTGGYATNGSGIVGTPVCAMTVDGEVMRTSNSSYQFSIDREGIARICRLNYQKGTATCGDASVKFAAVNNDAVNNAVTLYTSKFWGSSNQTGLADQCYEVAAMPAEGETFKADDKWRLVVSSEPGRTGDMTVPAGGFVLLGRGTAQDFIAGLKPGDVVTLDNLTLTPDGEAIHPEVVISGNPKNIGGGVNLNSEGERGDASQRHPRTGIGFSADGSRLVMMVIDGRSASSAGVTTGELGDMLLFTGCDEGVNLDGGGSSTLYTEALGIRNVCSDGHERAVANSIYAVLEAPADSKVAELVFHDYRPVLPQWGVYTPQILAFNAAGLCIDPDFKDFTLTCPEELGEISEDGHTIFIKGTGLHPLTAHFGDTEVTVPVRITDASEATLTYDKVIIDRTHPYNILLTSPVGNNQLPLNPRAFEWTSSDVAVAAVNSEGKITAVENGSTSVIGVLNSLELTQNVEVQNPEFKTMRAVAPEDIAKWKLNKQSISDASLTVDGEGFIVDYTVSGTRGTKLTLNSAATVYGCPEKIEMTVEPTEAKLNNITINVRVANQNYPISTTWDDPDLSSPLRLSVNLADIVDTTDSGIWPVEIYRIAFGISDEKNASRQVKISSLTATYGSGAGVDDAEISDENASPMVSVCDGYAILSHEAESIMLTDPAGRVLAKGAGSRIALPEGHGAAVVTADGVSVKVVY
ncbi:MAG: phosphodiester glycosidase family protein [Muribaculaceae bacterium]|nr:phosphodiester glycosidase family protein [Muribaculaceae bacterium]